MLCTPLLLRDWFSSKAHERVIIQEKIKELFPDAFDQEKKNFRRSLLLQNAPYLRGVGI